MTGPRGHNSGHSRGRGRGKGRGDTHRSNRGNTSRPAKSAVFDEFGPSTDQEMNSNLPERFRRGRSHSYHSGGGQQPLARFSDFDISLNTEIRKYVQDENTISASDEDEFWIELPEIPERDEIDLGVGITVKLKSNKPGKRFKTISSYLKTHYLLLREDAVGPLREAVDKFRDNPLMDDGSDLSIYEKVHICGFKFANMGIAARMKFSTRRAGKRILWSASKRLVSGSLVALSPSDDEFRSICIVAIVAARPLALLEQSPPEVDIYFGGADEIEIDPQVDYIMVEAKQGYFEAYRHTLKALQKLGRESFPLSSQLLGTNVDLGPPAYLAESSERSLAAALDTKDEGASYFKSVDIIDNWPQTPPGTTLDNSQWKALNRILTEKLAIVQGPPGTGKTYVSKVALEIMVRNRAENDPPIIVAAQTNHALDQLLKHVSKFDPEYIRLGGRSTNQDIKKRALYEIRQRERIPAIPGSLFGPARRNLEREHAKYGEILSIFDESSGLLSSEKLLKLGAISAAQEKSLTDAAKNWITSDDVERSPLQYWLHNVLIPFEVAYDEDDYGFGDVEEDLEIEQLRETEAEHGLTDEEDIEMLKGPWKAVFDKFTVVTPSEADIEEAKRLLDTKQDLWDIPEYLRGPVYWVIKQKAKEASLQKFRQAAHEYTRLVEELKIGKWEKDAVFLKRANIIGMTTTGLSKYRPLISSLHPKIILIEEAAEVIEGPVTAACMESLEHLILVGDHKQLQGHCALQDLEGDPYYLNMSMFERLVYLKMPFETLSCQRRMIPEIRELVSYLYPNLKDHESVHSRPPPPVWGTGLLKSYFFHHDWSETKDETYSCLNEEEARMIAKFYRHLLRNGVPPNGVTILTFYNGQRKRILKELRNDSETFGSYNIVKTVDSYQGEENDIVILSLVRNNAHGSIGFLAVDNRVCVALSRARSGFYIFGNGYLVSEKNDLWSHVGSVMSSAHPTRLGTSIPLTCINHNRTVRVEWPEDFDKLDGGCDLQCEATLNCGHTCSRMCHPMSHDMLLCNRECGRMLSCGHCCKRMCYEFCECECEGHQRIKQHNKQTHQDLEKSEEAQPDWLQPPDLTNVWKNSENDLSYDTLERKTSTYQSGRVLARGGAAFQPIHQRYRSDIHATFHDQNEKVHGTSSQASKTGAQIWSDFVSGGARHDDSSHELTRTGSDIENGNLLDLDNSNETQGTVENSTEVAINAQRSRFTQTYRPATSSRFGSSATQQNNETPTKDQTSENVQNLMD